MNRDFETLREELTRSLVGLDERQTQLRPGGDAARWSIQQIAGHLMLTYAATEQALDARIEKGTPTKATPALAQRIGQLVVIRLERFPRGRQAPERVTAAGDAVAVAGGVLIAEADAAIARLDQRMDAAEEVFGPRLRAVSHMVLGPMNIRQWRRFHLVHGRHHIKQILKVRGEYGV